MTGYRCWCLAHPFNTQVYTKDISSWILPITVKPCVEAPASARVRSPVRLIEWEVERWQIRQILNVYQAPSGSGTVGLNSQVFLWHFWSNPPPSIGLQHDQPQATPVRDRGKGQGSVPVPQIAPRDHHSYGRPYLPVLHSPSIFSRRGSAQKFSMAYLHYQA